MKRFAHGLFRVLLAAGLLAAAVTVPGARGEIPRTSAPPDTLQMVLDRIHIHASNDKWKEGGFKDELIEKWLDRIIGAVAKAADVPDLKLPVRLATVRPADQQVPAFGRARVGSGS